MEEINVHLSLGHRSAYPLDCLEIIWTEISKSQKSMKILPVFTDGISKSRCQSFNGSAITVLFTCSQAGVVSKELTRCRNDNIASTSFGEQGFCQPSSWFSFPTFLKTLYSLKKSIKERKLIGKLAQGPKQFFWQPPQQRVKHGPPYFCDPEGKTANSDFTLLQSSLCRLFPMVHTKMQTKAIFRTARTAKGQKISAKLAMQGNWEALKASRPCEMKQTLSLSTECKFPVAGHAAHYLGCSWQSLVSQFPYEDITWGGNF